MTENPANEYKLCENGFQFRFNLFLLHRTEQWLTCVTFDHAGTLSEQFPLTIAQYSFHEDNFSTGWDCPSV